LGIAHERDCGRGDSARVFRPGRGILVARRRRHYRFYAGNGEGACQCNLTADEDCGAHWKFSQKVNILVASHCTTALLRRGYRVRALDNLDPQIHGPEGEPPNYLDRRVELLVGDIRSPKAVRRALTDTDVVCTSRPASGSGKAGTRWPITPT
jgi:hypothetical protein